MTDLSVYKRITVVPADGAVYLDNHGYSDMDLSSCNIPEEVQAFQWEKGLGWIEFLSDTENKEVLSISDFPVWVQLCVDKYWEADQIMKSPPPPPTPEQYIQINKNNAKFLLINSDWAMLPDVNITNRASWVEYRTTLRQIFFNPPDTEFNNWPTLPETLWE